MTDAMTKARFIYLLILAASVAYVLAALMKPLGMNDGGGFT
ncbi:MAG TPA: hypothetical protein VHD91_01635 [Gaiellaceae bacterium]|nr:hypothetical protein [Gaiellaceae bacterium]